jgi:hypothetical protein
MSASIMVIDAAARRWLADRLGAVGFLSKPIDFVALRRRLQDLIGRHHSP